MKRSGRAKIIEAIALINRSLSSSVEHEGDLSFQAVALQPSDLSYLLQQKILQYVTVMLRSVFLAVTKKRTILVG